MFRKWLNPAVLFFLLVGIVLAACTGLTVLAATMQAQEVYLPLVLAQYPPPPSRTAKLLITEVIYNPASEPAGEWVEIYNPGLIPAELWAYKLGDEETYGSDEGMMQFPAGVLLNPGAVVIVANKGATFQDLYGFPPDFEMNDTDPAIPDMLPYYAWSTGKVELINVGDELLLLDGNDDLVDALTWGNSAWEQAFDPPPPATGDGESLERSPAYTDSDSAADWVRAEIPGPYLLDLSTPTPTLSPTPEVSTGPTILLLGEVLYDPTGDDPAGEWIELYNAGEENAALWHYRLGDEETRGGGEGMYAFPAGAVLFAGETAVIAREASTFVALYGFNPDFEVVDTDPLVPNLIKDTGWASGSMNLSASGDEVLLLNANDLLVDGVSWGASKVILDPSVPLVDPGHSIERFPPGADSDTAADWREQYHPSPGQIDLSTPTPTATPTPTSTATSTPTSTSTPTATATPTPLPPLIFNEIHADPDDDLGDANADGDVDMYDDEFVEIVNTTENPLDISGWQIRDLTGVRHVFSDTTIIPAGCAVVVFGGGSPQGDFGAAVVQVSSTGTLGLNNSGDTLSLLDSALILIDLHQYGSNAGDGQSITRDPDITGSNPMVKHSLANGSQGALFSPGTHIDGSSFAGCAVNVRLKSASRGWRR